MTDNLPPLPFCAPEFKPRWPNDPGGYNEDQMKAYARAAIERQSVPDLNRLAPFVSGLGKAILQELIEDMAAATQPQPVQEPVAYLDIGAGGYLDIATNLTDEQLLALPKRRHALVIAGTFGIDGYTSPQAQPAQPLIEVLTELESMYDKADQITPLHKGMRMAISTACYRVNEVMKKHGITKGTT